MLQIPGKMDPVDRDIERAEIEATRTWSARSSLERQRDFEKAEAERRAETRASSVSTESGSTSSSSVSAATDLSLPTRAVVGARWAGSLQRRAEEVAGLRGQPRACLGQLADAAERLALEDEHFLRTGRPDDEAVRRRRSRSTGQSRTGRQPGGWPRVGSACGATDTTCRCRSGWPPPTRCP